jgi:phosphoribosylanthranilate isomerase
MSVKIKICGLTSLADALAATEAGADALGLMFYEGSPRHVSLEAAAEIARPLPPHVLRVGVFVNASAEFVSQAIAACGLGLLQFHGDEPPEFCAQFGVMSMKAFRIRDAESLKALPAYRTDAWLLDACAPGRLGGTGATFNWELAVEAQRFGRPIFLAGGLTPENVGDAVRRVLPFGVDVSSGVESAPGRKNAAKLRAFVAAVRAAG